MTKKTYEYLGEVPTEDFKALLRIQQEFGWRGLVGLLQETADYHAQSNTAQAYELPILLAEELASVIERLDERFHNLEKN